MVWAVIWHVNDHAEYETFSSKDSAWAKYRELDRGRWAARIHEPGGRCLAEYGYMNAACWQQLEDKRMEVQENLTRGVVERPFLIKYHVTDHCVTEEYWNRGDAENRYNELDGGQWATRLYNPDGQMEKEYGWMSQKDWDMLIPPTPTNGRVEAAAKVCIVSFPGENPSRWNKILKTIKYNFACVWTGSASSAKSQWFYPWQANVTRAHERGNQLVAVKKQDGSWGHAQREEVHWIESVKQWPLTKVAFEDLGI